MLLFNVIGFLLIFIFVLNIPGAVAMMPASSARSGGSGKNYSKKMPKIKVDMPSKSVIV